MKILITGNSGYIGSHLTNIIKKSNIELHGLDKDNPIIPVDIFLQKHIIENINNWNITEEYDCVIHLAAEVSVNRSVENPILYYQTNVIGTLNVLKNIKTKRFIHASTGAAVQLSSPYGISKRASEEIVNQYCKAYNIPFTIFRFYNVTGTDGIEPTNPDGLMFNLIKAQKTGEFNLYGTDYNTVDGTAVRDYVHVNEICYSLIEAIGRSTNQIENLGHGTGISVQQMINLYKEVNSCDFKVNYCSRRVGDLEYSVLDNPSKFMKKMYTMEDLLKVK